MSTAEHPSSPYKGLDPFLESDAELFFGRKKDTRIIIANLFAAPLTILYGMSGVGKSSVLRAGVAHQILKRDDVIAVVFTDWEKNPLKGLKDTIAKTMTAHLRQDAENPVPLPSPDETLSKFLSEWAALLKRRLAIILDQFEDYLQYQHHPEFIAFADEFAAAVMLTKARVSFLVSIREDSLARLDRFEGSIPILFDNYLRLEHLDEPAAREAIESPVKRYSELYMKESEPYSTEPDLVNAVLEQVRVGALAPGSARGDEEKIESEKYPIDTVFLQLVMTRLWDEEIKTGSRVLQLSTLESLGGAKQIVQTHLDKVMNALTPGEQSIAADVFKYLVSPSGIKVAYPVHELVAYERVNKQKLFNVLNNLSQGDIRILRKVTPAAGVGIEPNYEISHDALGHAILDWMTRYIQQQEQLKAQREAESKKTELKQKEQQLGKLRKLLWLVSILSILLLSAMAYVLKLRQDADSARAEAVHQKREADKQTVRVEKTLELNRQKDLEIPFTKSVMNGHKGLIKCVAFSPNSKFLVTGSDDFTAKVWNVSDGTLVVDLSRHDAPINDVAFSPDGKYIATASDDNTARIWDANTGIVLAIMKEHTAPVRSARFSPDGTRLVTASADNTARLWSVYDSMSKYTLMGKSMSQHPLIGHTDVVHMAEFSPDGKWVVTASGDGTARIWDAETGKSRYTLAGHKGEVLSAKFSAGGKSVVTASEDHTARIWDANKGNQINLLTGHAASVNSAEFDVSDVYVVTASSDKTVRIWEAKKLNVSITLSGHTGKVNTAKFSPDGARIVTSSADRTARTWEAKTGNALIELRGHVAEVNTAIFSSDNHLVATASNDETARVWETSKPGGFQVLEAFAEPINYQGPCPATIQFKGRIVVAEGNGVIRFRFALGDTTLSSGQKEIVNSVGRIYIGSSMRISPSNAPLRSEKLYLEITEPNRVVSSEVPIRIKCYPNKPVKRPAVPEATPEP